MGWQTAELPLSPHEDLPDLGEGLAGLRWSCGCTGIALTDRETAVLEQLAEGKSTSAAARSLYVSPQAITYHVGNLLAKFGCTSRTGVVSRAFVLGMLARTWPPRVIDRPAGQGRGHATRTCRRHVKDFNRRRTLV